MCRFIVDDFSTNIETTGTIETGFCHRININKKKKRHFEMSRRGDLATYIYRTVQKSICFLLLDLFVLTFFFDVVVISIYGFTRLWSACWQYHEKLSYIHFNPEIYAIGNANRMERGNEHSFMHSLCRDESKIRNQRINKDKCVN